MYKILSTQRYKITSHENKHYLEFGKDNYYRILDGNVTTFHTMPLVSIGSDPNYREWILLDPQSPYLNKIYTTLLSELARDDKKDVLAILNFTMKFVRRYLPPDIDEQEIEKIIADHDCALELLSDNTPMISLNTFIEKNQGVCRHHSLFICHLLSRLIQDELLPPGDVFHHRSDLANNNGHAWAMYKPDQPDAVKSTVYFIDSYWYDQVYHLIHNKDFLKMEYGREVIIDCLNRYNKPNLETVPYDSQHPDEIKKLFIDQLINASREQRRKLLNHQHSMNALADLDSYEFLRADVKRILTTDILHKTPYAEIKDADDRQQFILGLLCLSDQQRVAVLDKQSNSDLYQIAKSLTNDHPNREQLYRQFDNYQTVIDYLSQKRTALKLITSIKNIISLGQIEAKSEAANWLPFWKPGKKLTLSADQHIRIPRSFKRIFDLITKVNIDSADLLTLNELIASIRRSAADSIQHSKKKDSPDNAYKRKFLNLLCNERLVPTLLLGQLDNFQRDLLAPETPVVTFRF